VWTNSLRPAFSHRFIIRQVVNSYQVEKKKPLASSSEVQGFGSLPHVTILSTSAAGINRLTPTQSPYQFGHNDQNQKRTITAYKDALKRYIVEARKCEANPVLLTPMNRRNFGEGGKVRNSLGDYPEAVREVAQAEKVMLVDLHAMSKEFYESLGEAKSKSAFVDNTHTNEYGGYQFARYIAETIQKSDLPLAKHVIDDLPAKNLTGK
jgi:hypothetical protein